MFQAEWKAGVCGIRQEWGSCGFVDQWGRGDQECSESELDAIAEDFLGSSHPRASEQAPEVAGR